MTNEKLPAKSSTARDIDAFLKRAAKLPTLVQTKGRLIFAIDATMRRTWTGPAAWRKVPQVVATCGTALADDPALGRTVADTMNQILIVGSPGGGSTWTLTLVSSLAAVAQSQYDAALVVTRETSGRLAFDLRTSQDISADKKQLLEIGTSGEIHREPSHPYTKGLLNSFPSLRGQRRELFPQVLPAPLIPAEQRLHPVRPLMPGLLRDLPGVSPHVPRQREHVVERRRDAPRLPHHPAEHPPDQRIGTLPALRRISYACHRGRGIVFCFRHKLQKASHGRPRYTPHERHAPSRPPQAG